MKSPKDMRIIQIDVTNACIHHCSNCTRFCGLHKKPFFMDFETFKRAVDSLEGYVGTIGIMGGEPTLNPDFTRMAEYLASKRPAKHTEDMLRPQRHFMDAIHDLELEHTFLHPCPGGMRQTVNGPGLWSAIGENYKRYYETIQDTIQYQALNDHSNAMYHQPALISRKALGISDKEWFKIRDNCWVQNLWSATVTPKGAFFCEVAGALDMLFNGPGGWKIEQGWWEKKPEEFGEQLQWCELCGLACDTFMRDANEGIYDVSLDIYERLEKIGSPLAGTDHINKLYIKDGKIPEENKKASKRFSSSMPYTESYSARFNENKTNLTYKELVGIIICPKEQAIYAALESLDAFSEAYIYARDDIIRKIKESYLGNTCVRYYDSQKKKLGYVIYEALKKGDYNRYAVVLKGEIKAVNALNRIEKLVLNPGTLLYSELQEEREDDYFQGKTGSGAALFNGTAHSIRDAGWDAILQIQNLDEIVSLWQTGKVFAFAPETERKAPSVEIIKGKRYAIYGAGGTLHAAIEKVKNEGAEVAAIIDSSEAKIGTCAYGFEIQRPEYLMEHREAFDKVLISSTLYYREIKDRILQMRYQETDIAWI